MVGCMLRLLVQGAVVLVGVALVCILLCGLLAL